MVTGPGHAMGGPAGMRAGHADREQVIDVLKAAFVQGRLSKDELDERVSGVFASRTFAELAVVIADIPAGPPLSAAPRPAAAPLLPKPAPPPARPSVRKVTLTCVLGVLVVDLLLFLLVLAVPYYGTVDMAVLINLGGLPLVGGKVLDTWRESHERRPLPPRARPVIR
jgi:hypothetical protein